MHLSRQVGWRSRPPTQPSSHGGCWGLLPTGQGWERLLPVWPPVVRGCGCLSPAPHVASSDTGGGGALSLLPRGWKSCLCTDSGHHLLRLKVQVALWSVGVTIPAHHWALNRQPPGRGGAFLTAWVPRVGSGWGSRPLGACPAGRGGPSREPLIRENGLCFLASPSRWLLWFLYSVCSRRERAQGRRCRVAFRIPRSGWFCPVCAVRLSESPRACPLLVRGFNRTWEGAGTTRRLRLPGSEGPEASFSGLALNMSFPRRAEPGSQGPRDTPGIPGAGPESPGVAAGHWSRGPGAGPGAPVLLLQAPVEHAAQRPCTSAVTRSGRGPQGRSRSWQVRRPWAPACLTRSFSVPVPHLLRVLPGALCRLLLRSCAGGPAPLPTGPPPAPGAGPGAEESRAREGWAGAERTGRGPGGRCQGLPGALPAARDQSLTHPACCPAR